MTDATAMDRRAQNRLIRHEFEEARAHGLKQRHAMKLRHLTEAGARQDCRCEERSVHRHRCSYDDVIGLLSAPLPDIA
ncbi:hypothetical protein [Amycolatopsis pithecellobii]|uniref:Uncharacterized protein n=1 Tax=Amycolatopsis pithecellobii TaxID=664692 RepID=A0A6N7Z6X6_9PSEU|nr:hypothetical protein [Amycolatopsis pithecellobii]MTD56774.1 hypothetical protein [Amycolatopsis pithecellobii]